MVIGRTVPIFPDGALGLTLKFNTATGWPVITAKGLPAESKPMVAVPDWILGVGDQEAAAVPVVVILLTLNTLES